MRSTLRWLLLPAFTVGLVVCSSGSSNAPSDAGTDAGLVVDSAPPEDAGPHEIRHIVVILKENRTFDNYFTGLPGADTSTTATLSNGQVITRPPAPDKTICDIDHTYAHAVDAYDNGKLDHFDVGMDNCPSEPLRPFFQFSEAQIPNYWQYARNFAISDHFFATVTGPSTPGHLAIVAGWSPAYENPTFCFDSTKCGCIAPQDTVIPTFDPTTCTTAKEYPCFDIPSVVDALPQGYTWMAYGAGSGTASESTFNFVKSIGKDDAARAAHSRDLGQFSSDMGTNEQANLVYAFVGSAPISEGPPDNPCAGENYTVDAVNKIMKSPMWKDSLVIVTWDDFGGNFDHVAPPVEACPSGGFYSQGFRLPVLLISPFARKAVVHTPTELASIPKLVEDLWHMPHMATRDPRARDDKAGSLLEAIDLTQDPRPPMILPTRTCP